MIGPTVGRIVHYRSYGTPDGEYEPKCRAAIVTEVSPIPLGVVDLAVVNPSGLFFDRNVRLDETGTRGGTWHWPCVRSEEE